jgi:protein phosphatase
MINIQSLKLDRTKRVIVVSDIHAHLQLFKALLKKVNYTEDDYLFINGDLCEKGPNSLEVVEYVRSMMERSDNIYITKGNCDVVFRYVFNGVEGIIPYMKQRKNSILNEMLNNHQKSVDDFANLQELECFYREHFQEIFDWLESLPVAYETEDFIVIHAGVENIQNWHETEEKYALYGQEFLEKNHQANKPVIVGHWPVVNYRSALVCSNNPIIDFHKKIISIDGGNQIKKDGQLNALIFENSTYSFTFVDELTEEMIILKDYQDPTGRVGTVTYPNYDMKVLDIGEHFTLCENTKLGIEQWIKNEYLEENIRCKDDLSTTFLSVSQGEKVLIVDNECEGYVLVKKLNGEIGWIPRL